jgi:hypothetical protein
MIGCVVTCERTAFTIDPDVEFSIEQVVQQGGSGPRTADDEQDSLWRRERSPDELIRELQRFEEFSADATSEAGGKFNGFPHDSTARRKGSAGSLAMPLTASLP